MDPNRDIYNSKEDTSPVSSDEKKIKVSKNWKYIFYVQYYHIPDFAVWWLI